ncbi:MAG: phosphoglycerate kinase [bacterium]
MDLRRYKVKDIKKGTRVLMRIEANVPVKAGKVVDGKHGRLARVAPEIKKLAGKGAKIVLMAHFGRPKGKKDRELSLKPVANELTKLIGKKVLLAPGIIDEPTIEQVSKMKDGSILLLENLRFDAREQKNSKRLAKALAKFGDVYINNAFGVCHRKAASTVAITKYLPSFAGNLVAEEIEELSKPFDRPLILLLGGIKLETKLPIIQHLGSHVDAILTGGGISITLAAARTGKAFKIGSKTVTQGEVKIAKKIIKDIEGRLHSPIDFRVDGKSLHTRELKASDRIVDIGCETEELYRRILITSRSVVWNGPMGWIEETEGRKATLNIAKVLAGLDASRTILGGGDTVAFVESNKLAKDFNFISTGGGAMLAFLAGEKMSGLAALQK